MVRVEMMAVGRELLIGRTLNTNTHWVGGRLARMGTMLKEVTTVDDELDEIAKGFLEAVARSPDFLVVVGGLGPTPDDMTLKGLARGLGVGLRLNAEALAMMKEHYARRGMQDLELTPSRKKMARLPVGAKPVRNPVGTAPGVELVSGKTTVFSLPGVPSEMKAIFLESVEPEVKGRIGDLHRKYVKLRMEGILESALAPLIEKELRRHPGAYVKSHPRGVKEGVSRIELDVAVVGDDRRRVEAEGENIVEELTGMVEETGGTVKSARGAGRQGTGRGSWM